MKTRTQNRLMSGMMAFTLVLVATLMGLNSCGSKTSTNNEESQTQVLDAADFYATQPLESGLYDADYYDIVGKNPRKGRFDGRIYFALSPDLSAFNVFENGNRTKIDYTVVLEKPFERNDSGVYCSVDKKNNPVCLTPDSTYTIKFIHFNDTVCIGFNPKPRHVGTAVEIMEKIGDRKKK